VAVPDDLGATHIAHLERVLVAGGHGLTSMTFELLWLDGRELRRRTN
jgi:hypothetical protein